MNNEIVWDTRDNAIDLALLEDKRPVTAGTKTRFVCDLYPTAPPRPRWTATSTAATSTIPKPGRSPASTWRSSS